MLLHNLNMRNVFLSFALLLFVVGFGSFALPSAARASSASIQALSPGASASVGAVVSFSVAASGFAEPAYSVSDSMSGSSVTASTLSASGIFSWTPTIGDVGNHILTVTVQDSSGAVATAQASIFINSPPTAEIQSLSPGALVRVGQTVTFSTITSGFAGPTYAISDSHASSTVSGSAMSNSGYFAWTPQLQDAGEHTLVITVSDLVGHSTTTVQAITVSSAPAVLVRGLATSTVAIGSTVSFSLQTPGFTDPVYAIRDSSGRADISAANLDRNGNFVWVPKAGEVGAHTLVITASDAYAHSANTSVWIEVVSGAAPVAVLPHSSGLTEMQIQAILSLLQTFGADQETILQVSTALGGRAGSSVATPENRYSFSNFLDIGSGGPEVSALQERLAALGFYTGPVTGYFGSLTQAAVRALQSARGIEAAGYVGPATRAALNQ